LSFLKKIFGGAPGEAEPPARDENPPTATEMEAAFWTFASYFLEARDPEQDLFIESWSEPLGRSYQEAIRELLDRGIIARAGLKEKLSAMLRIYELEALLRELDLPASGKKDTLLRRYIEARPQDAEARAAKMQGDFLVCTPEGRKEVKFHTDSRANCEDSTRHEMSRWLRRGKAERAAAVLNDFLKSFNLPPKDHGPVMEDVKLVLGIKDVSGLSGAEFEKARVHAAIELLWDGKLNALYYSQVPSFHQFDLAASIVIGKKRSREELKGYSEMEFVNKVEIMCLDDSCRACKAAARKKYLIKNAPLLPVDGCTHENGCRCSYVPVVD
jgi:hypothetical protein